MKKKKTTSHHKKLLFIIAMMLLTIQPILAWSVFNDADEKTSSGTYTGNEKLEILQASARKSRFTDINDYISQATRYLEAATAAKEQKHIFQAHYILADAYYHLHNMKKSQHHADVAFDMSIKADNDLWYARSLILQAMYSIRAFSLEDARIQLEAIERIYTSTNRRYELAKPFLLKAYIAEHQNNIQEARKYMQSALNLASVNSDSIALIPYKKYQADFYNRRGDFIEALSRYKALSYFEQRHGFDFSRAETLVGIATIYLSLNDCDKASETLDKAFLLAISSGNVIARARILKYRGNCQVKQEAFREAERSYNKALEIFLSKDEQLEVGRVYNNLGVIASEKNNYKLAKKYFDKSLAIYSKYPFYFSKAKTFRNIGKLHLKQGQNQEGLHYLNKSIDLAKKGNYTEILQMNYKTLIFYYESQEDYQNAIEYYHKASSLEKEDLVGLYTRLTKLQEQYERDRRLKTYQLKNAQYKNNQLENKSNSTIRWLAGALIFLILLLIALLLWRWRRRSGSGSLLFSGAETVADHNENDIKKARYTFNTIGDGVVWVSEKGAIMYLNQMAQSYSQQETPYQIDHLIDSITPERWHDIWNRLKNEHPYIMQEHTIVTDDKEIPVEVSMNLISHQQTYFVSMIIKDITKRKRDEEHLRRAKERAEESDRLKTRFIVNMSHEIRTPVNTIGGFAAELRHEQDPAERVRYIEMISKSSERLISLVNDILEVSKLEAKNLTVKTEPADLHKLLRQVIEKYRRKVQQTGKQLVIIDEFPHSDKQVTVYVDVNRYVQVLNHLLSNAVKFTPEGEIKVGYTFVEEETVEVYVQDTGIGIKKEYQSQIFDLFSQADSSDTRKYQGSGLGLSISKKLMTLMQGSLTFETEEGAGSIFITTLKGNVSKQSQQNDISPKKLAGISILLLSDSATNNAYLKAILKKSGAILTTHDNLKKALADIPELRPDIILVSQPMLLYGEKRLCEVIKEKLPEVKIVLLAENALTNNNGLYDGVIRPQFNRTEIFQAIAAAYYGTGRD